MTRGITRRTALAAGAGLLAAPPIVREANAQSAFDWKRFSGERIEVSLTSNPRSTILIQNQREFEDLTGIRVGAEQILQARGRVLLIAVVHSGEPEAVVVSADQPPPSAL